jgi:hypothetical protein
MQRLVTSHPDAFIWGEHGGHLEELLDATDRMAQYSTDLGSWARREYEHSRHQGFIANLAPEPARIKDAFRDLVDRLFVRDSEAQGKRVWGFKEIRYDLGFAQRLQEFLPRLCVISIVRDPRDILCSLDEWETHTWTRERTRSAIGFWHRLAVSLLAPAPEGLPVLRLRYEDYTADPEGTCRAVAELADLDVAGFDRSVFGRRVHRHGQEGQRRLRPWHELPDDLRALLDDDVAKVARGLGYDI